MLTKTAIPFGAHKTGKELKHERIRECAQYWEAITI